MLQAGGARQAGTEMQNVYAMRAGLGAIEQWTLQYNIVQEYYLQGWAGAEGLGEPSRLG